MIVYNYIALYAAIGDRLPTGDARHLLVGEHRFSFVGRNVTISDTAKVTVTGYSCGIQG